MNIIIPELGAEPVSSGDQCVVHFERTFPNQYGTKVTIDLPHPDENSEPKEHLKELDWDETHRQWSPAAAAWTADFDCLNEIVTHMLEGGFSVSVNIEVAREFEEEEGVFLPENR